MDGGSKEKKKASAVLRMQPLAACCRCFPAVSRYSLKVLGAGEGIEPWGCMLCLLWGWETLYVEEVSNDFYNEQLLIHLLISLLTTVTTGHAEDG